MTESINIRTNNVPDSLTADELRAVLQSILTDLTALRAALNAHTHDGVSAGAASTGIATVATMGTLNTTI